VSRAAGTVCSSLGSCSINSVDQRGGVRYGCAASDELYLCPVLLACLISKLSSIAKFTPSAWMVLAPDACRVPLSYVFNWCWGGGARGTYDRPAQSRPDPSAKHYTQTGKQGGEREGGGWELPRDGEERGE